MTYIACDNVWLISKLPFLNTSASCQFHTWHVAVHITLNPIWLVATISSTFLNSWYLGVSPTEDIHEFCLVLRTNN